MHFSAGYSASVKKKKGKNERPKQVKKQCRHRNRRRTLQAYDAVAGAQKYVPQHSFPCSHAAAFC